MDASGLLPPELLLAPNAARWKDPAASIISRIRTFAPPNVSDTPQSLFITKIPDGAKFPTINDCVDKVLARMPFPRFVRMSDPNEMLIFIDGACPGNGQIGATGGCAFVWNGIASPTLDGSLAFRLEEQGPTGQLYEPTSNRAELRAAIAALEFRVWAGEGWKRLVIATDSEYVALGATSWVHGWKHKGWKTCGGTPVKNRDLWESLLELVSKHAGMGLEVLFWRIPRSLNQVADREAKRGAEMPSTREYTTYSGCMC